MTKRTAECFLAGLSLHIMWCILASSRISGKEGGGGGGRWFKLGKGSTWSFAQNKCQENFEEEFTRTCRAIYTGKRTEWSPMSVCSHTKIAVVGFVNHEYDDRPTSDDTKST